MVGVDGCAHDAADVEGLLASRVALVREDVADAVQRRPGRAVRGVAYVAVDRVRGGRPAREALAGRHVCVLVVAEKDPARPGHVGGPVLGLAVGAHDPLVAADAEVVLGRDRARVVEGLLARQDHRARRRHDQDAARVHEHRRLGVPVGLGAHVDPGHDDVDLGPGLRDFHDPAQHRGDPVHVLGAAVHGDLRPGRQREPLHRHAEPLGEVERRDDPPALRLGERAERAGRIPEDGDPLHPLRVALGRIADQADDDAGGVVCKRPVDRHEAAAVVEVVLGEGPVRGGQQPGDLGRVHEAAPAGGDDAPRALVEGLQGPVGRVVDLDDDLAARRERRTAGPAGGRCRRAPACARS